METFNSTSQPLLHPLAAGLLPGDFSTELFGDRQLRTLHFLNNGSVKTFKDLPQPLRVQIEEWLRQDILNDKHVKSHLGKMPWSEALEEYSFCLFGSADNNPDFCSKGKIQKPDNFRCGDNCRCLKWKRKTINYDEVNLTIRELQVLDLLKTGKPVKLIAHELGIAEPTLNNHKTNIMTKLGAQNTTEAIYKAGLKKILQ